MRRQHPLCVVYILLSAAVFTQLGWRHPLHAPSHFASAMRIAAQQCWLAALSWTALCLANVEKTVFIAPPPPGSSPTTRMAVPPAEPARRVADGHAGGDLGRLSPMHPVLRTRLNASFADAEAAPRGSDSWLFVDGLQPGRRYELRICWLATVCRFISLFQFLFPRPRRRA